MKNKITVILFLVIFECNGHGILGDILSSAQKRAESVAGAVLGGLNILGNRQNHQDVPQKGPEETIIIVVEEPKSDYGNQGPMHHHPPPRHPPPHHHHHHHHRPPFNNDSPPPPPPPHHGRPPPPPPPHHHPHPPPYGNPRPGDNFHNEGPSHHNEYGNHHNPSYDQNSNNFHVNNGNDHPYENNNGNFHNNGYQPNSKGTEGNQENNYFEKPTTEQIKTPDPTKYPQWQKQDETDKTTKRPSDKPLYVPLNPNEYIYGGDKINITAPKRDTDQTKTEESGDDDFDIDIRLKNE